MKQTFSILARHRVVPAVVIDDAGAAAPLAEAMIAGGLPVVEVTLRTPESMKALKAMAAHSEMLVGAGTVTTLGQLQEALDAGAQFVVTPGLEDSIIRHCLDRQVPVIPGAVTPTEILRAQNLGLGVVKFFPCNAFGGLPTIEALAGPFPAMKFLPTGGISLANLRSYLNHPSIFGCGGTWMVKREWLQAGAWEEVRRMCSETAQAVAAA